jgi:ribosome recycling factor
MIDETLAREEDRMKKTVEALDRELAAIRTGHAHVGLVEHVTVDYHGTSLPVNQLATIAAPEARLLTIQPWDQSALGIIEKAIQKSDLGLTPSNDGHIIRLAIPQLTADRRKELIRLVHRRVEDARVAVRNIRRDGVESMRRLVKDKEVSEDEERRGVEQLQKLTDRYVAVVDQRGKEKEAELEEV